MSSLVTKIYDKIDVALKEIKRIQDLIRQGYGRPEEKDAAFKLAKEVSALFTDEIFKRKAEKLNSVTIWTNVPKPGNPFLPEKSADQLNDWVALLEEHKGRRKIKSELASDKIHIESVIDGEDQHIIITEKGSKEHAHLILDGGTGEIRVDPKDQKPHGLIKSIRAQLELKTGETAQITRSALNFVEPESPQPDIRAYTSNKDGYFVLEIYNNGDEDLEDFRVQVNWLQLPPEGAQERVLDKFNDETDYLVMAHPKMLNMLKKGARVYSHIPSISADKKIRVTISCKGMKSGKPLVKIFELETRDQYK